MLYIEGALILYWEEKYMLIDGKTKLLGVLGQEISHTLSPLLHNEAAKVLGKNIAYVPFDYCGADIDSLLATLWGLGCEGFNVTVPFKGIIASKIGGHMLTSINTVYRGKSGWMGVSTDGGGFVRSVEKLGSSFDNFSRLVFLGNGGAVFAIIEYIFSQHQKLKKPDITVLRRNREKDKALLSLVGENAKCRILDFYPQSLEDELKIESGKTLLVQATSAPIRGDRLESFVPAVSSLNGAVVDITYGKHSYILDRALEIGISGQDGLPMLIEQARLSQEYWWGEAAPYELLWDVIQRKNS